MAIAGVAQTLGSRTTTGSGTLEVRMQAYWTPGALGPLQTLSLNRLKELCRAFDLDISGRKADLAARLMGRTAAKTRRAETTSASRERAAYANAAAGAQRSPALGVGSSPWREDDREPEL